ncbi:MAG TPA: hypothetical protein VF457_19295, partial [Burkholderiaceae bacterium]
RDDGQRPRKRARELAQHLAGALETDGDERGLQDGLDGKGDDGSEPRRGTTWNLSITIRTSGKSRMFAGIPRDGNGAQCCASVEAPRLRLHHCGEI